MYNIGITVESDFSKKYGNKSLLFSNGFNQNVFFLFELYKIAGHSPFWVSKLNETNHKDIKTYEEVTNENTHIIIETQIPIKNEYLTNYNGPIVSIIMGNQLYIDMEHIVHNTVYKDYPDGAINRTNKKNAIWMLPHHYEYGYQYQEELHNCPVHQVPMIWEPSNCPDAFSTTDFNSNKPMNIVIMEPNINKCKNSLIPISIVNNLWKRNPNSFNQCWVISNNDFHTDNYFKANILTFLECFHGKTNKATFAKRATLSQIKSHFNNEPFIILAHQENCDLNYLYLEALHCNIPLVHNSPALNRDGVGYYYDKNNIKQGSKQLELALMKGMPETNKTYINSYSINHIPNQSRYVSLIEQEVKKKQINRLYSINVKDLFQYSANSLNEQTHYHLRVQGAKLYIPQLNSLLDKTNKYDINIQNISKYDINENNELKDIMQKHGSDKSTTHNYNIMYSYIFNKLGINNKLNVLEIGLGTNDPNAISSMGQNGQPCASLYGFKEYLPNSNIYGADIDRNILYNEERIKTCFVDQLEYSTFKNISNSFDNIQYDIIIDDGLHSIGANFNTLIFALDNIKENGWIVIEDIHIISNWNCIDYILKTNNYETYIIKTKSAYMYCIHNTINIKSLKRIK